jgi:hypothetical protein
MVLSEEYIERASALIKDHSSYTSELEKRVNSLRSEVNQLWAARKGQPTDPLLKEAEALEKLASGLRELHYARQFRA